VRHVARISMMPLPREAIRPTSVRTIKAAPKSELLPATKPAVNQQPILKNRLRLGSWANVRRRLCPPPSIDIIGLFQAAGTVPTSPAEPFLDGRELNLSAGRRISGRLSEIFPQSPPIRLGSPAAQPPSTAGGHPTPTRSLAAFVVGLGADCAAAVS
jgi:hypothetical protein